MLELVYTSARSGLKTGSSGFTSVAWTRGIPPQYIVPLENRSGYKPVWRPDDPKSIQNPVSFAYQKIQYGNFSFSALTRSGYAGLDYSGRSNKIAHHIIPENTDELFASPYGPAGAFLANGNFCSAWEGEARLLSSRQLNSPSAPQNLTALTWKKWKGDAGWAGYIAKIISERLSCADFSNNLYFEYDPEMPSQEILQMIAEIMLLLPPQIQELCTFNTYFIQPEIGVNVFLCCMISGTPHLLTIKRLKPRNVFSLNKQEKLPEEAESEPLVRAARFGIESWKQNAPEEEIILEAAPLQSSIRNPDIVLQETRHGKSKSFAGENMANMEQQAAPGRRKLILLFPLFIIISFAAIVIFFLPKDKPEKRLSPKPVPAAKAPVAPPKVPKPELQKQQQQNQPKKPVQPKKGNHARKTYSVPSSSPKQQHRKLNQEVTKREAKDFFLKLNTEFAKQEHDPGYRLFTAPEVITGIEICSKTHGKNQGESVTILDRRNRELFKLTAKGKDLLYRRLLETANDPECWITLCEISEIRIMQQNIRIIIPFSIDSLLDDIQPKIRFEQNSYTLIRQNVQRLKDNQWIEEYLVIPDFDRYYYKKLADLIQNWNSQLRKWNMSIKRNKYFESEIRTKLPSEQELKDFKQLTKTKKVMEAQKGLIKKIEESLPYYGLVKEQEFGELLRHPILANKEKRLRNNFEKLKAERYSCQKKQKDSEKEKNSIAAELKAEAQDKKVFDLFAQYLKENKEIPFDSAILKEALLGKAPKIKYKAKD